MDAILYIEDNLQLAEIVKNSLTGVYMVDLAGTADQGIEMAKKRCYDLFIIDYYLESEFGLDVCIHLRQCLEIPSPILFLTRNSCNRDIISALDSGADDYLTKPFDLTVLKARLRALLRRKYSHSSKFEINGLIYDKEQRIFKYKQKPINLPRKAFMVLKYMFHRQGEVVSRSELIAAVWNDRDICSNTVDVHVTKIRTMLQQQTGKEFIDTVYGIGYRV